MLILFQFQITGAPSLRFKNGNSFQSTNPYPFFPVPHQRFYNVTLFMIDHIPYWIILYHISSPVHMVQASTIRPNPYLIFFIIKQNTIN